MLWWLSGRISGCIFDDANGESCSNRIADGSVEGWVAPEGPQAAEGPSEPAFVEALGSENLSPSHPEDWAAADVSQGQPQHRLPIDCCC